MCLEFDDDVTEELAMGRCVSTKAEAHLHLCGECQNRVRQCREWIAMLRLALNEFRRFGERPPSTSARVKRMDC